MASLISEPHQLSGQCIARRYQVSEYLFYDSTFSLFRAQDLVANEPVTLLCFSPGLHLEFPEAFYQLENHMQRMTGVHHPCGLQLLASGEEHDILFFVEEFPKGQSLAEILDGTTENKKPLLLENALTLFHLLYQTLTDIHQFMTHGFLNPQDIYLESWPRGPIPFFPKIAHFGMRAILSATPLAFKGLSKESVYYAAPEFGTSPQPDKRTDVYGLGVLLYSLLTMQPPAGCFIRPSRRHSLLTKKFDLALIRSTEIDPDQRYASIKDFHTDLKQLEGLENIWAQAEEIYKELSEYQKEESPPGTLLTNKGDPGLFDEKDAPPPIQTIKTPPPNNKTALEEGLFLIEGPGRIICLLIIILLNLALFGLTAKEHASLDKTPDINTQAFTKWEQFFLDSEIKYAQGIGHAE